MWRKKNEKKRWKRECTAITWVLIVKDEMDVDCFSNLLLLFEKRGQDPSLPQLLKVRLTLTQTMREREREKVIKRRWFK